MRRDKIEIISDILDICCTGANKTKIVYQANLNFRTVNPYLDMLLKKELIELGNGSTKIYKTTAKGLKVLKDFRKITDTLE